MKKLAILVILIFLTISVVNATDNATYTDLNDEINQTSQSVITLERDYKWSEGDNLNGTVVNKSVIIDGKNHTLDGSSQARAFYILGDNVTIQNINFKNGKALGLYYTTKDIGGGAIHWLGSNGKLINCTFINNEAKGLAYDPYIEADQEFIDNETGVSLIIHRERPLGASTNRGGSIVWFGDNGFVENCEFIKNTVDYPDLGGAIYWKSNNATVKDSKFINNYAWAGGAIYYSGNNLTVYDSEFLDNGLFYEKSVSGENFTLINTFKKLQEKINQADCELTLTEDYRYMDDDKNGILINKSITIDGANHIIDGTYQSRIFKITSDNVVLKNINFINSNLISVGGSILWIGENATIINCTFRNNIGSTAGGAVAIKGNNTKIINSTFENNTVKSGNYGALSALEKNPEGLVYITIMVAYGGAVYINGNNALISNSIFINNTSQCMGDFDGGSQGGAVKIMGLEGTIVDSKFINNQAAFGLHYQSTYNITIKNTTFSIDNYIEDEENPVIEISEHINKDLSKIIADNLIIYFKSNKTFSVKVYDENGKLAKNVYVIFTLNNKHYKVKTNKNGEASLKITLKPGKYTIITLYNSKIIKKSITVKNRLITNDLTKKVKKIATFKVKVLNTMGKVFARQNVKIIFKGKTYNLKTNSFGIASLKLSKNIKIGKYTIKTVYNGLTNINKVIVKR